MLRLGKITVKWKHINPELEKNVFVDKEGTKWIRKVNRKKFYGTICTVKVNEDLANGISFSEMGELIIEGKSHLHYDYWMRKFDGFDKEIGRKISLVNALSRINFTKEEKEAIWKDYHNRKKQLK